jgi:acyl-CoA dehydrogenase
LPEADLPLVVWCCDAGFAAIERSFDEVFRNYPSRFIAGLMRMIVLPFGVHQRGPADALSRRCAEALMTPGPTRERLTAGVHPGRPGEGLAKVEHAFELVTGCAALRERVHDANGGDADAALAAGVIDASEHHRLQAADAAVAAAVAVDHFDAESLSPTDLQIEESSSAPLLTVGGSS